MRFEHLKQHIEKGEFRPCYYIFGEDKYLISSALNLLSSVIENPAINKSVFEKGSAEADIISALSVLPWGADKRIVIVRDFDLSAVSSDGQKNSGKEILKYLENPNPYSILVFTEGQGTFFDKLKSKAEIIECSKLTESGLREFIFQAADIDNMAAGLLIQFCLGDMGRISAELEKLKVYAQGEKITEDMVRLLVIKDLDYKAYELTDNLAKKNVDKAYEILNDMAKTGDISNVLSLLYNYFRRMLYAVITKESEADVAAKLNIKEFAVKSIRALGKNFGALKLKKITELLHRLDFEIKSGKTDKKSAIDIAVLGILNA